MATYPGGIPSFTKVTPLDYPTAAQFNSPNDEIEAICTELGVDPHVINDQLTAPAASPASVAAYLDMLAYAIRTLAGVENWYQAAIPNRILIGGNGNGGTVASGGTSYPILFGSGLTATETLSRSITTFQNMNVVWDIFHVELLTAMPAGAGMSVTLRNGTVDQLYFVIPGGAASGVHHYSGEGESQGFDPGFSEITFAYVVNQFISVALFNAGASASAQIGAWAIEGRQVG